ncbi:hypothetical protein MMC07_008462 [Pseudocyphellaria aurata]|nr:hypothetical protein [Pseudocyphellaria aurata]
MCTSDIFLGLIAILFPPIAVWIKRGLCTADSLINIALCMLGYIPGLLHAWYIIAAYPEPSDDYDALPGDGGENGGHHVTYYYVNRREDQQPKPQPQPQRGYGTTGAGGRSGEQQHDGEQGSSAGGGVPPSYEQAVRGDHKVQT